MRYVALLLLFFKLSLFAVDFDCVFIGSSPIPLMEALYQSHLGKRVLILEQAKECGGAWKSISVCGLPHADLGCHQISNDPNLKQFMHDYMGCNMVSLDDPLGTLNKGSPNGFYPSQGCHELISSILNQIAKTNIVLLLNHHVEGVHLDMDRNIATVRTNGKMYTTSKIYITPTSCLNIDNFPNMQNTAHKSKTYHLYLLIQDSAPFKFTYNQGVAGQGIARVMNLTPFASLHNSGYQLIVIQTYNETFYNNTELYVTHFKNMGLLSPAAKLIKTDTYTYEQSYFNQSSLQMLGSKSNTFFEVVNTAHIQNISSNIQKWKTVLRPVR